jgi:hypothetical protein
LLADCRFAFKSVLPQFVWRSIGGRISLKCRIGKNLGQGRPLMGGDMNELQRV